MPIILHPECGKQWSGSRREHCPACHETFNSAKAADRHRRGDFGVDRRCLTPEDAGLIATQHDWGIAWQTPDDGRDPRRA